MKIPDEWHKRFFKNSFYNPASPAAVARAPEEARFVLRAMKLKKGDRLLDLCCGPARHAVLLAGKGLAVTGYDFSTEYLREAAAKAKKAGVKIRFLRGDMRDLKFNGKFDAVIDLFTSFGYFRKFSDDIKTLKGVARALKPGGLFMIDIVHGDHVRNNFKPKNWTKLEDGSYLLEDARLTKDGVLNTWTTLGKGKVREKSFFTRLYSKDRIAAAMRKAGLIPLKFWGGFNGAKLTRKTNRLIALARKAG
jgi:ubiquinone/menaquinone biosynthesis C-methylase UbiE